MGFHNSPILVLAATGRIGRLVVAELLSGDIAVRCLVRDIARAQQLLGESVELVSGDLNEPDSIVAALRGAQSLFLASALAPDMAELQCNAVNAAALAGIQRVVKLSGSGWTMNDGAMTRVGTAHAAVERELLRVGIPHVNVRPNAFTQGMLGRIPTQLAQANTFSFVSDSARVGFTDMRDIARFCALALTSENVPLGACEITGPRALSGNEIATLLSQHTGRPIVCQAISVEQSIARARAAGESEFNLGHLHEVLTLISRGAADRVTPLFSEVTGQPARHPMRYLEAALADGVIG